MKQEIIADLSRITEEEQAILDGKTEVEKERYSSGQKFVMDAGKLLERGKLIDIRAAHAVCSFSGAQPQLCRDDLHVPGKHRAHHQRGPDRAENG